MVCKLERYRDTPIYSIATHLSTPSRHTYLLHRDTPIYSIATHLSTPSRYTYLLRASCLSIDLQDDRVGGCMSRGFARQEVCVTSHMTVGGCMSRGFACQEVCVTSHMTVGGCMSRGFARQEVSSNALTPNLHSTPLPHSTLLTSRWQ